MKELILYRLIEQTSFDYTKTPPKTLTPEAQQALDDSNRMAQQQLLKLAADGHRIEDNGLLECVVLDNYVSMCKQRGIDVSLCVQPALDLLAVPAIDQQKAADYIAKSPVETTTTIQKIVDFSASIVDKITSIFS